MFLLGTGWRDGIFSQENDWVDNVKNTITVFKVDLTGMKQAWVDSFRDD